MARLCSSLLLSLLIAWSASAVTMEWTFIGDPGNAADTNPGTNHCGPSIAAPCGAVAYSYQIGTYEVTNAQYIEFLNAKAKSDPLFLYDLKMADPSTYPCCINQGVGGIVRSGTSGSYTYSAIAGRENLPVNYVSFFDALRFANWMNNGQGGSDTETGSYTLLSGAGGTPSNHDTVMRNVGAAIAITNENEWYKAAYYASSTSSYFTYPTASNTQPTCSTPTATPNTANCNRVVDSPNGDLTPVGSHTGSASPYGTLDQGGNAYEWTELHGSQFATRVIEGGSYESLAASLRSVSYGFNISVANDDYMGFRLVLIPEPSTGLLVIAGLVGLGIRRHMGL
jgi:formylglycine-generating enzyme required for sulfatase activity